MSDASNEASNQQNGAPTKVLVVDDHSVTRHGVVLLCTAAEGVEVIGEASDGNEAIARVTELLPDVVLMDVDMPRRDGISATKQIRQDHPSVGVVVLTVHEDQETIFEAIKAGASGYLPKSATLDDIRALMTLVEEGVEGAIAGTALYEGRFSLEDALALTKPVP